MEVHLGLSTQSRTNKDLRCRLTYEKQILLIESNLSREKHCDHREAHFFL